MNITYVLDIHIQIAKFCDDAILGQLLIVCKQFNNMVKSRRLWNIRVKTLICDDYFLVFRSQMSLIQYINSFNIHDHYHPIKDENGMIIEVESKDLSNNLGELIIQLHDQTNNYACTKKEFTYQEDLIFNEKLKINIYDQTHCLINTVYCLLDSGDFDQYYISMQYPFLVCLYYSTITPNGLLYLEYCDVRKQNPLFHYIPLKSDFDDVHYRIFDGYIVIFNISLEYYVNQILNFGVRIILYNLYTQQLVHERIFLFD